MADTLLGMLLASKTQPANEDDNSDFVFHMDEKQFSITFLLLQDARITLEFIRGGKTDKVFSKLLITDADIHNFHFDSPVEYVTLRVSQRCVATQADVEKGVLKVRINRSRSEALPKRARW